VITISPLKVLIVLVVALLLLGPDKVPQAARQIGAGWSAFRRFRQRMEEEIRETVPDLPATHEIVRAVRSPMSFLDNLADLHGESTNTNAPDADASDQGDASDHGERGSPVADQANEPQRPSDNGAKPDGRAAQGPDATEDSDTEAAQAPPPVAETPSGAARSYRFTVPDDPSLN